jgi:hypothetical protein
MNPPTSSPAPYDERRIALIFAMVAGLCWACVPVLLAGAAPDAGGQRAPEVLFAVVLATVAAICTFAPIQRRFGLPGLTIQGTFGAALLTFVLGAVPYPRGWIMSFPDTPVYVLLAIALFWSVSAVALPITYVLGMRVFRNRARRYDQRRARRHAYEIGAAAVALVVMAGLRVLTPVTGLLVVAIIIVVETLLLWFVEAEA